jgi:hypothetical protein
LIAPVLLAADAVQGQATFLRDIPPGKYSDIVVRFSGDSLAANTFVIADLGRIRLTEAGRDLVNVDADNLRAINSLKGGASRLQAVAGGASAATLRIPRGYADNNVHQIIEADVVQVQMQFGPLFTTHFTAADVATIKVYGLVRETGEMAYNMLIHQIDNVYGAGVFTLPLRHENVIAIYLVTPATPDLDRVRVVKDGVEMANVQVGPAAQDNDLQSISDLFNQTDAPVDAAAYPFVVDSGVSEISLAEPGEIGEFLSDDVVVEFSTSPAATYTQECVVFSADFTPTKLRQTKVETAAVVQRKISRKNTLGRGRPVQTLRIAAE